MKNEKTYSVVREIIWSSESFDGNGEECKLYHTERYEWQTNNTREAFFRFHFEMDDYHENFNLEIYKDGKLLDHYEHRSE